MSKQFPGYFLVLLFFVSSIQCKTRKDFDGQEIVFTPISEFNFEPATLSAGAPLKIIAWSGGQPNEDDKIFYYQFIAIDSTTGDTVRILSTLMSVKYEGTNKTYSPVSQYDPDKRILSAIFFPQDDKINMVINLMDEQPKKQDTNEEEHNLSLKDLEGPIKKTQYIAVNKSLDIFSKNYKTAFGVLEFTEQPW